MMFNSKNTLCALLILLPSIPLPVYSESKSLCFNFYIISKESKNESEITIYEKQKKLILNQLSRTQRVFDENQKQSCPKVNLSKGNIRKINWNEALLLSRPLELKSNETLGDYYFRKTVEAKKNLEEITKLVKQKQKLKYYHFLEYSPVRKIVYAENALDKLLATRQSNELDKLELSIKDQIGIIKQKLDEFEQKDSAALIEKDRKRVAVYDDVDKASALSWVIGEMTLWNDIEAQNTSIELKNLFKHYRTPENQCLDVYVVPSAKTPSRDVREVDGNGKWTQRGGAAISTKLFPRTTDGKGHGIVITYDSGLKENRLAHELGHLLIDKRNAHKGKKKKDLMHEDSRGGSYLDEAECREISINIKKFSGGAPKLK